MKYKTETFYDIFVSNNRFVQQKSYQQNYYKIVEKKVIILCDDEIQN